MQRTKAQLREESNQRLVIQVEALKKDIKALAYDIKEFESIEIKNIDAEPINVLMGIRRDLLLARDNVRRVKRLIT